MCDWGHAQHLAGFAALAALIRTYALHTAVSKTCFRQRD